MVDWNNPQTQGAEYLALVKIIHIAVGIYIWEYISTLWFEWQVITRRRMWRWSMLIYFATRLSALAGVVAELVGFNLSTQFDCQVWIQSVILGGYISFALNSLLILLRTISVWERRPVISIALTTVWLTHIGFLIYGITVAKSVWLPSQNMCLIIDSQKAKLNVLASCVTDLILLLTLIFGVIRLESKSSILRMLYRHGMVYIVVAAIGSVPPTVFLFLNLNVPMNLMLQTPGLVIVTICSTRLYRSLATFEGPRVFDSFLNSAHLASMRPVPRGVRLPPGSSRGKTSLSTSEGPLDTNVSLEVEFPTSYGRYRAEDLELAHGRLKEINEEGEEFERGKAF